MTGCWDVDLDPVAGPGASTLLAAMHLGAAIVPWVAGCGTLAALALSGVSLLALPASLRAIPGPWARVRRLRSAGDHWWATLADGQERPAELLPASRVLAAAVFCRVRVAGQELDWWLPAYAVSAGGFRRFKVALRCRQEAGRGALLDSSPSKPEEAARRGPESHRAN